ncbi:hypothetical protein N824_26520 [Pedobacter sp. V48]|nr:hypothetical protein N824_26520 [Pedobacter sp. V48]
MAINVDFRNVVVGDSYDRPTLAQLWGYQSHQAISRGVVTPVNSKTIVLFVTKDKQQHKRAHLLYIYQI